MQPFKEEIEVDADDLPQEARAYTELLEEHAALSKLLSVKDEMIEHLLQERATLQAQMVTMAEACRGEVEVGALVVQDGSGEVQIGTDSHNCRHAQDGAYRLVQGETEVGVQGRDKDS